MNGKKTIPAASLRGPIRSVFEIITNSCFSNLADRRLSYRLPAHEARTLVPARIEKSDNGTFQLRLLTGVATLSLHSPPKTLYPGAVRLYEPRISKTPSPKNAKLDVGDLRASADSDSPFSDLHGVKCKAVLLKLNFPPAYRVLRVAPDTVDVSTLLQAARETAGDNDSLVVQSGWLCITNHNTDNKHSERFFFQDGDPHIVPMSKQVLGNYEDLIKDYQERHARTVKSWQDDGNNPAAPHGDDMAFSRFILDKREQKVRGGELVYAQLHGRGKHVHVEYIAPVSVPRVAYDHTIGQLLPDYMHRCEDIDDLCPACRAFGWVEQRQDDAKDQKSKPGAYAGRLRFSHASIDPDTDTACPEQRLAVLGSPNPTTSRFYLFNANRRPEDGRSDESAGYDGNGGTNLLRGRKVYRHHKPTAKVLGSEICSDQNRSIVDAAGIGAQFEFDIHFENLAEAELGALLWAIEMGDKGYHRLGYGKPLGLGSMEIAVREIKRTHALARYTSLHSSGQTVIAAKEKGTLISAFQQAMVSLADPATAAGIGDDETERWQHAFEQLDPLQDLLALVGRQDPELDVHYPYSPEPYSKGQFEWFVGNNRKSGPGVELALPTEDQGLPLIDKRGKKRARR